MSLSGSKNTHDLKHLLALYRDARREGGIDRSVVEKQVPPEAVSITLELMERQGALLERLANQALPSGGAEEWVKLGEAVAQLGWKVEEAPTPTVLQQIRNSGWAPWLVGGATAASVLTVGDAQKTEVVSGQTVDLGALSPGPLGPPKAGRVVHILGNSPLWVEGTLLSPGQRQDMLQSLLLTRGSDTLRVLVAESVVDAEATTRALSESLQRSNKRVLLLDVKKKEASLVGAQNPVSPSFEEWESLYAALEVLESAFDCNFTVRSVNDEVHGLPIRLAEALLDSTSAFAFGKQAKALGGRPSEIDSPAPVEPRLLSEFDSVPPEQQPLGVWVKGVGFRGDPESKVPAYRDGRFNPEVRRYPDEVYRTGVFPPGKEKSALRENLEDWRGLRGRNLKYDPQQYFDPGLHRLPVDKEGPVRDSLLPEDVEQGLVNCFWAASLHASLSQNPTFIDKAVREVPVSEMKDRYPNLAPELREIEWFEVTVNPKNVFGPHREEVLVCNLSDDHLLTMGTGRRRNGYSPDAPMSLAQLKAVMFEKAFYVWQGSIEEHEWGNSANALANMHGTEPGYHFTDFAGKMKIYRSLRAKLRRGEALVAVAYDLRDNLDGELGKLDFLLKIFKERDAYKYKVTDQHCYSIVEARKEATADGGFEHVVYVRDPHLYNSRTGERMPTPRGPEWDSYLAQQKRLTLDEFHAAYTFITHAPVPGATGYPAERSSKVH